ncbi:MAG: ABC transporter ATP-binding protein/permease [Bacteriovoracaceae bacterium]|nr:ABC transporter ATP-binding protein/permease [Bacteriovoracaceae bacterium]
MSSFQGMPYTNFLKKNTSDYIYSIQSLTAIYAQGTFQSILRLISEGLIILSIFTLLFIKSGLPLLILAGLVLISTFTYDLLFRKKVFLFGQMSDNETKRMIQGVVEGIEGLREIRIFGRENYFFKKVIRSAKKLSDLNVSLSTIRLIPRYLLELIIVGFIVSLINYTLLTDGNIVKLTSVLTMFAVSAMRLIPSVSQVLSAFSQLVQNRNAVGLLYDDLKALKGLSTYEGYVNIDNSEVFQKLTLDNISFSYNSDNIKALKNINLTIEAGTSIGLIGTSGSGKTTFVNLLLGLLVPQEGFVKFNDNVLNKESMAEWIQEVAYIPQDTFLVNDSLRKNIALGKNDNEIDEKRIKESIKKSNLEGFVSQLPAGLDTIVGERGARLSGGQKQRVAIARTFYYDRSVLVMDEATSALDNKTEREIVEEIKNLKGQKTLIVVAHRLSTLKDCDVIYRMENGRIVDKGSYEEIVEAKGTV